AELALVRELAVEHVEAQLALLVPVVTRCNELELCLCIDEAPDEPSACHAIDVNAGARHPGRATGFFEGPGRSAFLARRTLGKFLFQLLQQAVHCFPAARVKEVRRRDVRDTFLQARDARLRLAAFFLRELAFPGKTARQFPGLVRD